MTAENLRMRLQFISCKVMQREAYFCAARSKNVVDVVLMEQGLHDTPDELRNQVQKALDNTVDLCSATVFAATASWGSRRKSPSSYPGAMTV